jgi:Ca2+-binding EF-hand superfamily protein
MTKSIAELRETFSHFDDDGNGLIDPQEFLRLIAAIDPQVSREEAEFGFSIIDTDGNQLIDFDEFRTWWLER